MNPSSFFYVLQMVDPTVARWSNAMRGYGHAGKICGWRRSGGSSGFVSDGLRSCACMSVVEGQCKEGDRS